MKSYRLAPVCLALLTSLAVAQGNRVPRAQTAWENPQMVATQSVSEPTSRTSKVLRFCPPQTCLYYAGDFDSANSNANGLFNFREAGGTGWGYTFVGVKPVQSVSVTGATFNEFFTSGFIGDNPTPFGVWENMSAGQRGSQVCNTVGNATIAVYGESDFGLAQYNYTVKRLSKLCALRKGKLYFVNLLPVSNNGDGYLVDVEDKPAANHRGWKDVVDDSFFDSSISGTPYEPTWGSNGACNGIGCDAFSIALTGKKTQ